MSGAIMNKVWDLFGMDNAEDKDENEYEYEDYEQPEEEGEEKKSCASYRFFTGHMPC